MTGVTAVCLTGTGSGLGMAGVRPQTGDRYLLVRRRRGAVGERTSGPPAVERRNRREAEGVLSDGRRNRRRRRRVIHVTHKSEMFIYTTKAAALSVLRCDLKYLSQMRSRKTL